MYLIDVDNVDYYNVYDNSWCINLATNRKAFLLQTHENSYEPDKKEDGALFEIVSNPYKLEIADSIKYGIKEFINVKSTKTGYIYRVLYNRHAVYNL